MTRRPRVYDADLDALQHRLRYLLAVGDGASERDVAGYEAERARVLDLIGDQLREQRAYDARMQLLRDEVEQHRREIDDEWVFSGAEASHQASLDALAHVDHPEDSGDEYPIQPGSDRYDAALRHGEELREADLAAERRRVEDMVNAPYRPVVDPRDDVELDDSELDDRDRVFAEAPASHSGAMWFTPDEAAPGGVCPITDAELRAITDRVRATQAEAVADDSDAFERRLPVHDGAAVDDGRGLER